MAQRSTAGACSGAHGRAGVPARFRWAFVLLLLLLVLATGLAGALLHAGSPRPALAQAPTATPIPSTIVHVQPVTQDVAAGQNFSVTVNVQDVTNLAAYEFTLAFDPSVVSYVSVVNSPFLGSTQRSANCFPPLLTPSTVRFACATFGSPATPGPSGNGLLATVTLHTTCDGASPLNLTNVTMGTPLGINIPTQMQSASVTVTGGGACPTPTPSPTGGPTSTPTVPPPPTAGGPSPTALTPTATPTSAPQQCGDAAGASMCVLPVSQTAYAGSNFSVVISVDNVTNLGAFQFDLAFNSALVAPVSVVAQPYLGSTGRTVVCQQAAPQLDRIGILCVTLGAAPPGPDGSGLLATVTLQALPGTFGLSSLHLTNVILASISAAEIPVVAIQDGVVAVVQPPTPTSTPSITPTFTRTPTPTPTPCPTTGCPTATPTNTPTNTPTATSTPTNTPTPTPCPTTGCPTATPTNTPTNTSTSTPTPPPTSTATSTPSPTPGPCGGGGGVLVVCLQPVSNTAYLGVETTVNVAISGVPELGAFQFTLVYNSTIVTATDASNATFLASTGRLVTCIRPPQPAGRIELICNTLGAAPAGASGAGIMATVKLRGDASGLSPLSLQDVIITDVPGVAYSSVALQGGQVTVGEQPTATQTLTPTTTLTPTRTLTPTPCPTTGCPTATMTSTSTITSTPTETLTPPPSATPTNTGTPTPVPGPLTLRIAPPSQSMSPGDVTLVNVELDGAVNLGAFQITIQFNPSVVTYQSIAVGPFLGSTGRSVVCLAPTVQVDRVSYLCNTLGSSPPGPSGSGVLAYLLVRGVSAGLSPLHFSSVLLTDVEANLQTPASIQDGAVIVSPPATVSPSPVPTSSVAAGGIAFPAMLGASGAEMVVANVSLPVGAAPIVVHALPGSGVGVYKNPDAASIYLGDQPVTIYEVVTDVPAGNGLGAYELTVQFDPNLVSINILNDSFLGSTGRTVYCLKDVSQPQQVKFSCVTSGTRAGPNGTGTIAKISVQAAPDLQLRAAPENGQDTVLDDVTGLTHLSDIFGNPIAITDVGDAVLRVRALEGDINGDCQVNVIDEQVVAGRYGMYDGVLLYSEYYDLMPKVEPDGLIDVHDLEVVYGRDGSTCAQPWEQGGPPQGQLTPTPSPSATPTNTLPPSPTPSMSATPTQTFTPTRTLTPSATPAATNTLAATATPPPTNTLPPPPTSTQPPPPTSTLPATATSTLPAPPPGTPTSTPPPTSTQPAGTPTETLPPDVTPTLTPTPTGVLETPTPTPTGTLEASVTPAPTPTQTATPMPTTPPAPTPTPTGTPTATATESPTTPPPPPVTTTPVGATSQPTFTETATLLPDVTPTETLPPGVTPTNTSEAATATLPPGATATSTNVPPASPTTGPRPPVRSPQNHVLPLSGCHSQAPACWKRSGSPRPWPRA